MNNKKKLAAVLVMMLAAGVLPSAAQTVYRCGDSYSLKPCHGSKVIDVEDTRSATQRSQTLEASQRDAKVADAMEKARLEDEAKAEARHLKQQKIAEAAAIKASIKKDEKRKDASSRNPADFTAIAPGTASKKSKAPRKPRAA
jgi:hypothetical protein